MLKIFNTQLNGIFKKIDAQEVELDIASRLLAQAVVGEGNIWVKGFGDLKYLEEYIVNSNESLPDSKVWITDTVVDKTDRVIVMAETYNEDVIEFVTVLEDSDIDYVLICNAHENIQSMNFIDLSTPRAIVPTEDFSRIITPHAMAMNYIYYVIYANMKEMLDEA